MESTRDVLLWEPTADGHHLIYVRVLAEHIAELGFACVLLTREVVTSSKEFQMHLRPLLASGRLKVKIHDGSGSVRELIRDADRMQADSLILMDGDVCVLSAAMARVPPGLRQVVVLVTRDPFLDARRDPISRGRMKMKAFAMRYTQKHKPSTAIRVLSSPFAGDLDGVGGAPRNWIDYVVDPVIFERDPNALAAWNAMLGEGRRWLGVFGGISTRKNVDMILGAFELLNKESFGLIIAGPTEPAGLERWKSRIDAMKQAGWSIVFIDAPLSNAEMCEAIVAVDVLVLAYSTAFPPSTLGKALAAGTRVVLAGPPGLRQFAQPFPKRVMGCELSVDDIVEAVSSIDWSTESAPLHLQGEAEFAAGVLGGTQGATPRA